MKSLGDMTVSEISKVCDRYSTCDDCPINIVCKILSNMEEEGYQGNLREYIQIQLDNEV